MRGSRVSQREIRRIDREEKDAELDAKIAQIMQQVEGLRAEKMLLKRQQECDDKRSEIEETQSQRSQSVPSSDEEEEEEEQAPKPVKKSKKESKTKQEKAANPTAAGVAGAMAETAKKRCEEPSARKSVVNLATTAGAAAAKIVVDQMVKEGNSKEPSLLELVKLLE